MHSTTNQVGKGLFFVLLVSMFLLFTVHLATGYLLLKETAINSILIIMLLLWGKEFFKESEANLIITPLLTPLAILVLVGLLSFSKAINPFEGLALWIQWLDVLLLVFLVANFLRKDIVAPSLNLLIGVGWVVSLYGILQEFGFDWVGHIAPHTSFSTFGNVNWAAQALVVLCPLALVVMFSAEEPRRRYFAAGGLALLLAYLFLTRSRGAWLAVTISGVFIVYRIFFQAKKTFVSPEARKRIILVSLVGMIVFTFLLIIKPETAKRLFSSSNNTRILIWRASVKIWEENPLLGVGLGNFKLVYPRYRLTKERAITSKDVQVDHTHNDYLQFLTDTGIIGLGAFLYFLFILIQVCRKALSDEENPDYLLVLGFIGAILGVLIHSLVSFPLQSPASVMAFAVVVAFLAKLSNQEQDIVVNPAAWQRFLFNVTLFSFCIFSLFFHSKKIYSDYWFNRGQTEFNTEKISESITSLKKATASYPFNFRPWLILGYAQNRIQNFQEAARAYEKGNNLCPNYYLAHYQLGNVYMQLNRFQEAITEFDLALALVPDFQPAVTAKKEAQKLRNAPPKTPAAIPDLQKTLTSPIVPMPKNVEKRIAKAQEFEKTGDFKKAIVEYQAAFSLDPSLIMINYNLGMIYLKTEEHETALRHFKEVAETEELPPPPRADAFSQIGYIHFMRNDFKRAQEYFIQAVLLDPESARGHQFLGNLYYKLNRKEEALQSWQKALEIIPENKVLAGNVRFLVKELSK